MIRRYLQSSRITELMCRSKHILAQQVQEIPHNAVPIQVSPVDPFVRLHPVQMSQMSSTQGNA